MSASEATSKLTNLDPASAALLIIDPQNAFIHPDGTLGVSGVNVAPAQDAVGPMRLLAERFKAAGLPVIWTKQVHLARDAARAKKVLASHTSKRKQVSALSGSWDSAFVDEIADLADDPTFVIVKHRFGAFYQTRLEALLDMLGVQTLFVAGVTANACVETTLREAYLRDYDTVAVTDAIAAVRPEWIDTAQAVWAQYLCELTDSAEVLSWLESASTPRARRLHHLLLQCADLAASEKFYFDLLGMTLRKREEFRDGRPFVSTNEGLGLVQAEPGMPTGGALQHVCFTAADVDRLAEAATAAGHRIVRGPGPGPYGHTVYIEDPDGNEVELVEPA